MGLFGLGPGGSGQDLRPLAAVTPVLGPGNVPTGMVVSQVTSGGSKSLGQILNQPLTGPPASFPTGVNQPAGGFFGPGDNPPLIFGQGPPGFDYAGGFFNDNPMGTNTGAGSQGSGPTVGSGDRASYTLIGDLAVLLAAFL